jgi:hypothetical protein
VVILPEQADRFVGLASALMLASIGQINIFCDVDAFLCWVL